MSQCRDDLGKTSRVCRDTKRFMVLLTMILGKHGAFTLMAREIQAGFPLDVVCSKVCCLQLVLFFPLGTYVHGLGNTDNAMHVFIHEWMKMYWRRTVEGGITNRFLTSFLLII